MKQELNKCTTLKDPKIFLDLQLSPINKLKPKISMEIKSSAEIKDLGLDQSPAITDNYIKIDDVYNKIQNTIDDLEEKISSALNNDQQDFVHTYENMLKKVKEIIEEYKKKAETLEENMKNNNIVNSLITELKQHKKSNLELVQTCVELRGEIAKLKSEKKSMMNDMNFCEKRFKNIKRENKELRMQANRISSSEFKVELPQKKMDSFGSLGLGNKSLSFTDEILEISKLEKEEGLERVKELHKKYIQRREEIILNLRQQLDMERKAIQKFKALQVSMQTSKSELEQYFCECVEAEKKKIIKSKRDNTFKSNNKTAILEEFLFNKKILYHIFATIFKSTNKLNKGLLGGPQNLIYQELESAEESFPQCSIPPIFVGLNEPRRKWCKYHHKSYKSSCEKRLRNSFELPVVNH